jgi:hypothetical protein
MQTGPIKNLLLTKSRDEAESHPNDRRAQKLQEGIRIGFAFLFSAAEPFELRK